MVDVILLSWWLGTFAVGFWAGSKFKRPSEMVKAVKGWFQ